MAFDLPPVGFYFALSFDGSGNNHTDAAFQEVSGLNVSLETKEIVEGGQNEYTYHLPVRAKYNELVLSRGLITEGSDLSDWIEETLQGGLRDRITTRTITLHLLNEEASPLSTWTFNNAYPVKWEISNLNAERSSLVIESLTFRYNSFKRF
jgi:phage tail-like protein